MVKDAEAHAEEDRRRREEAEERNRADTLVYQTEKFLREHGDKVTGEDRTAAESALAEVKDALGGDDLVRITSATEALAIASQKFATQAYEQASQEGQFAGAEGGAEGGPDDVVDAEVIDDADGEEK
jgi:molecular chaperone DnaK